MQLFFEIAESAQRLPNPLAPDQLIRLAQLCQVHKGTRLLDLACGKGELLTQWARTYDIQGTGVDESERDIYGAMTRATELEVWSQVHFVVSDVLEYPQPYHQYNIVSWLGMTGLPSTLGETIPLMQEALRDNETGLLLIGQSYWRVPPPEAVCHALGVSVNTLPDLGAIADQADEHGAELVEMMLVPQEGWDRYYSAQWRALSAWLKDNTSHPDWHSVRTLYQQSRRNYLSLEREYVGWGVFVLEAQGNVTDAPAPEAEVPLWYEGD